MSPLDSSRHPLCSLQRQPHRLVHLHLGQTLVHLGQLLVRNGQLLVRNGQLLVRNGQLLVRNGQHLDRNGQLLRSRQHHLRAEPRTGLPLRDQLDCLQIQKPPHDRPAVQIRPHTQILRCTEPLRRQHTPKRRACSASPPMLHGSVVGRQAAAGGWPRATVTGHKVG